MTLILIALAVAALYSGGMWVMFFVANIRQLGAMDAAQKDVLERYTFHLGLCFILSVGFIGLILK